MKIEVEFYNGTPIGVALPASMELTVTHDRAAAKRSDRLESNKPATLENGVTLYVPPFVAEGEKIRVNPAEAKYIERVK